MRIIDHGQYFSITFERDHWFRRNLQAVKALPEARWEPKGQKWWVSGLLRDRVELLKAKCRAEIVQAGEILPEQIGSIEELPDLDFEPDVKADLRPYQKKGVARGLQLKRFINGDEQGLGKTLQSITTIIAANQKGESVFPCLIVCPASLKYNWQKEIEKFTSEKAMILSDKVRNTWPKYYEIGYCNFFIVNYESLKKYFVQQLPAGVKSKHSREIVMNPNVDIFKSVIFDESHRCKDKSTQNAKLSLRVAHKKEWRILLSGTPVVNKPLDLWPQICIMGHMGVFGTNERSYKDRYCDGGSGSSNLREMNYLLNRNCFFRREKKDVAKDLPEKYRQMILCEITNKPEYEFAESNFKSWLESQNMTPEQIESALKGEIMVQMQKLKTIAAKGKMQQFEEFTKEVMEADQKLIVFCNLHEIVDQCLSLFPHAVTITGRDTAEQRQKNVERFQNDSSCRLIICNIKAAGVGITLTASSRVLFIEYPWTYADCVQCEDRAHRIGQVWPVTATYLMGAGTIDEYMWEIINQKREVASIITGNTDQMDATTLDQRTTKILIEKFIR